ncbi:MAG: NUDIX domain-containing protein [Burkholderiales bacterium]|nr:NUDIX domain-containing protein [Burkholderiales bacterium]
MSDARYPVSIKGVLFTDDHRVVLLMNDRQEWELPGGRIEAGETPEGCLAREIEEELSIAVQVETLLDGYLFEVVPGKQVYINTFGCRLDGTFEPSLSHEHTRFGCFALDALPDALPSGYRRSILSWSTHATGTPHRTSEP